MIISHSDGGINYRDKFIKKIYDFQRKNADCVIQPAFLKYRGYQPSNFSSFASGAFFLMLSMPFNALALDL